MDEPMKDGQPIRETRIVDDRAEVLRRVEGLTIERPAAGVAHGR